MYDHLLSCLGNSSVVEKDMVNKRVYKSDNKLNVHHGKDGGDLGSC